MIRRAIRISARVITCYAFTVHSMAIGGEAEVMSAYVSSLQRGRRPRSDEPELGMIQKGCRL